MSDCDKQQLLNEFKKNTSHKQLTDLINDPNINLLEHFQLDPNDQACDEMGNALIEYLYQQELNELEDLNPYGNTESYLLKKESMKRKREEKINYILAHRWDPRWLKLVRSRCCLPFALIALIFLIFTNVSANWIRFDEDSQRAGLWVVCNKTEGIGGTENPIFLSNSTSNNESNPKIIEKKKSIIFLKMENAKKKIQNRIDVCYTKLYLKEDTHLAIFCLSLIGLLFHTLGLILLFVGLVTTVSHRTLYFYHSAGECLITSAIVDILSLIAFVLLVSSQAEQSYKFGFSLYLHLIVSISTLTCSILLNLDDMVNEYRIWKIKTETYRNTPNLSSASMFIPSY